MYCSRTVNFAVCAAAAASEAEDLRPYPESLRLLLTTLAALDWSAPPAFQAKRSDLERGEAILFAYLRGLIGHDLRALRFIRQIGA